MSPFPLSIACVQRYFLSYCTYTNVSRPRRCSCNTNQTNIRGLQSNVIFVEHSHPEDDDTRIVDQGDGGSPTSKQNAFEVMMVLRIVCYLASQGYDSEDIVVLTPYLGQLSLLPDALKHERDPILSDLDSDALLRAGLLEKMESVKKKDRIRLVTIGAPFTLR